MALSRSVLEQLRGRPIGRILVKMGKLTRDKVHEALQIQKKKPQRIGKILIDLGYITAEDLREGLAAQRGMRSVDLLALEVDTEALKLVPAEMANTYKVFPVSYIKEDNLLTVAVTDPDDFQATDSLKTLMGFNIETVLAEEGALKKLLAEHYQQAQESVGELLQEISGLGELSEFADRGESIDLDQLVQMAESNPIKKLVNMVLMQAIREKASDIHFEPFENEYKMRYRIDNVLYELVPPPRHIAMAISSRIKVMAKLNIAERRMPQDGRIPLSVGNKPVDLRVSVLPTMFGESIVMRVLDRSNLSLDLEKLGMRDDDLHVFRQLTHRPNGIIVVTGPTGSGKTTTLYAALSELNKVGVKIITTENPVEYDIDGLIQVNIAPEIGLTFERCLRSILRQDPDIILVGEIRDLITAEMAVQASLTGHIVFTTVHTTDSPSTVARMLDLGLDPYLIAATMEGVVGQRLIRRICPKCKEEFTPTEEMLMELELTLDDIEGKTLYRGRGCDNCMNSGYRGRMAIFEVMLLNDDLRDMIIKKVSTNVLRSEARKMGMRTLRESGLLSIYDGATTIDEVVRATVMES